MSLPISTPYIRPALMATRRGIPQPALLTDLWLDQLQEMIELPDRDADTAYDLLACWARLRRVRTELIELPETWARAETHIKEKGANLAQLAVTVSDPAGWLEEARQFHQALEDRIEGPGMTEADLSEWAERLLTDLDDADLVAWAVRHLGLPALELEQQLAACADWMNKHADDWLLCGVYVQAIGQTLGPDLPGEDFDLAMTADKYVLLLDAQEWAEGVGAVPEPLPAEVLRRLFARGQSVLAPVASAGDWSWLPTWIMAADVPAGGVIFCNWRSPNHLYQATLAIGTRPVEKVRLNFARGDESASDLAGQSMSLAGVIAVIDAEGNADLPIDALRQARRQEKRPILIVNGVEWEKDG